MKYMKKMAQDGTTIMGMHRGLSHRERQRMEEDIKRKNEMNDGKGADIKMSEGGVNEPNEGQQALIRSGEGGVEAVAKMMGITPEQAKKLAMIGMRVMKSGGMVPSMEDGGMYQYNKELESMGDGGKMYGHGGVKPIKSYGYGGYMK